MSNPWPTTTVGELFDIGAGKSVTPTARHGERRHPFLRTSNVFWGRIDLSALDAMHFSDEEIAAKALKKGDLLVCEGGDIGRAAIWNSEVERCGFQNHLHRLRPRTNDVVPRFFMYYLQAGFTQLGIYEGAGNKTTIPNLSRGRLEALEVPKPPKPEQEKIAVVLWKIQRALEVEKRLIATAHELKQSAMRQLFTRGLRREPQKETDIGPIPESWTPVSASQIFKLTSGSKRPADVSPQTTAQKPFSVFGGNGVMGYSSEWFVDAEECLVIGRVGEYCGAIHLARGKVWITDNALYAKEWLNDSVRVDYLAAFLDYYDLNRFKRMAGQPLVTQGLINEHSFPIPLPEEQREIASILQTIDRKISVHEHKRATLQELFQTMLHQLMTAQLRVHTLALDVSEVQA